MQRNSYTEKLASLQPFIEAGKIHLSKASHMSRDEIEKLHRITKLVLADKVDPYSVRHRSRDEIEKLII